MRSCQTHNYVYMRLDLPQLAMGSYFTIQRAFARIRIVCVYGFVCYHWLHVIMDSYSISKATTCTDLWEAVFGRYQHMFAGQTQELTTASYQLYAPLARPNVTHITPTAFIKLLPCIATARTFNILRTSMALIANSGSDSYIDTKDLSSKDALPLQSVFVMRPG